MNRKGKQLRQLYDIITSKNPINLKFKFALWMRGWFESTSEISLVSGNSDTSVGRMLHKLGLSPQRPLRRAFQRDEGKVTATIYFGDEASVRS